MAITLKASVSRGKNKGMELSPHLHKDGAYVASMTRFEKDYVRVTSVEELEKMLREGFRIRMSAPGVAPSLIASASIQVQHV